jgi:hypothetical protein
MRSEDALTTDTQRSSLERLLRPRSIAVAGGLEAAEVLRQCQRIGFDGELYAIHPSRESIEGVRSVRAEMGLAPGAQLPLVAVGADGAARARLARVDALIRRVARLSDVGFADAHVEHDSQFLGHGPDRCDAGGVFGVVAVGKIESEGGGTS